MATDGETPQLPHLFVKSSVLGTVCVSNGNLARDDNAAPNGSLPTVEPLTVDLISVNTTLSLSTAVTTATAFEGPQSSVNAQECGNKPLMGKPTHVGNTQYIPGPSSSTGAQPIIKRAGPNIHPRPMVYPSVLLTPCRAIKPKQPTGPPSYWQGVPIGIPSFNKLRAHTKHAMAHNQGAVQTRDNPSCTAPNPMNPLPHHFDHAHPTACYTLVRPPTVTLTDSDSSPYTRFPLAETISPPSPHTNSSATHRIPTSSDFGTTETIPSLNGDSSIGSGPVVGGPNRARDLAMQSSTTKKLVFPEDDTAKISGLKRQASDADQDMIESQPETLKKARQEPSQKA